MFGMFIPMCIRHCCPAADQQHTTLYGVFSALSFCLVECLQSISLVLAVIINSGCYNGELEAELLVLVPKGSEET